VVTAYPVRSDENVLPVDGYPAVNLAPAFWGVDAEKTFRRALDANEPGAVAVDPVHRTARMLSDLYINGAVSEIGQINDAISTLANSATYVLQASLNDFNEWGAIKLDRDITFDLNGNTIFTVYVNNTFEISAGVQATVQNGKIIVGIESEPFGGAGVPIQGPNLTIQRIDEDFLERTTLVGLNDEPLSAMYLNDADYAAVLNTAGSVIELFPGADISIDVDKGTIMVAKCVIAKLDDCYGFRALKDENGAVIGYRVRLADTAANMPTAVVTIGAKEVRIDVGNTRAGMTYKLQRKTTLAFCRRPSVRDETNSKDRPVR